MQTNKPSTTPAISLLSTAPLFQHPSSPYTSALKVSKVTPRTRAITQRTHTTKPSTQPNPRTMTLPKPTHTTRPLIQPKSRTRVTMALPLARPKRQGPQPSQGSPQDTTPKHPGISPLKLTPQDVTLKQRTPLSDSRFELSANHIMVPPPVPLGHRNIMGTQGYLWQPDKITRRLDTSITFRHFKEDWGYLATDFLLSLKYLEHLYQHILHKESNYCTKHPISNTTPFMLGTPNEPVKGLDLFLYILYRKDLGHIIPNLLQDLHKHLPIYITSYTTAIRCSFSTSGPMGSSPRLLLSHRLDALRIATKLLPSACLTPISKDPFDRSFIPPAMFGIRHGPTFILLSDFTQTHRHSSDKPSLLKDYYKQLRSDGVDRLIRLNGEYEKDWAPFGYTTTASNSYGIRTIDLFCDDGYPVPPDILRYSITAIRGSSTNKIAIHCKSGLGRTGSIVAHWYKTVHPELGVGQFLATLRLLRHPCTIFENQENALFPKSPKR